MATLDFRVKNGLVTGANNTSLGTAVTVLLNGNFGIGDTNPAYKLSVSGTLNATGAITQAGNQVLHASNYNSYTPTLTGTGASGTWGINITGDAGTVDGLSVSTSQAVNTIVARDSNGYAFFNYINSNTVNGENPAISQVIVTNGTDGYYRKSSIASLTSAVQTNASGNWGINAYNITQYQLNQSVTTTSAPTFAGLTSTSTMSISSGGVIPLQLTTSSAGPWAISLARSDTSSSSKVYNDNGSRWYFEHRPSFAGSTPLDSANYNSYSPTLTGTGASGTWGISVSGSAATLTTARNINGTAFNGSASITTSSWGTARTVTIGSTGKSVDGSGNISWSLTEIGAPSTTGVGASGNWAINATNITAYTINQSVGSGNAPTFAGLTVAGDIYCYRSGGTTGVVFLTSSGSRYVYYDGTVYQMPGAELNVNGSRVLNAGNYNSYSPTLTGGNASGTWGINVTGSAYTLAGDETNWASYRTRTVSNFLSWKNYGSGHVIFDASNGTAPNGAAVNNTNPGTNWSASYPTLMGWNGSTTYGIRVDVCRRADSAASADTASSASSVSWGNVSGRPTALSSFTNDLGNYGGWITSAGSCNYANYSGYIAGSTFCYTTAGLGVGTSYNQGAGFINATQDITAFYSDLRLKENVKPIENAIEKIKQISGVTFNSNDLAESFGYTDKREQVGVIAQEIEKVLPQIIKPAPFDCETIDGKTVSKSGEHYMTVQYEKIVPLLIEAIKEQQKQIDRLINKIGD